MKQDLLTLMYQEKAPVMRNYLMKVGCSREDAEDIIQETFIKAITYMVHLEVDNVSAWLFRVAINRYYDLCRKNTKSPKLTIENQDFIKAMQEEDTGEANMLRQEAADEVQQVLEMLSPFHKNLLLMKYEMDLSYGQIGDMLDMKEDRVKTYLYRARLSFRKCWEERSYE